MSGIIARLRGTIEEIGRDYLIVEAGGVGYLVNAPGSTIGAVGEIGDSVRLRIYHYVKEDVRQLFGFLTAAELETFERLLGVTGVGPKGALAFLTQLSPDELANAIARRDADALARVRGVGRKTAERVILELQGKVAAASVLGAISPALAARTGDEAAAALMQLGYGAQEIQAALAHVPGPEDATVEERVFQAMRLLDRRG